MSLSLLRAAAELFAPRFQESFGPALSRELTRGLHLSFDIYWYEWILGKLLPRHQHDWDWTYSPFGDFRFQRKDLVDYLKLSVENGFWVHFLPEWDLRCRTMGYAPGSWPIVFRVILREPMKAQGDDLPRSFEGFPIIYEVRPPAIAVAASTVVAAADNVGRQQPAVAGTAGGFLQDINSGTAYLLSCAHVLGNVGDVTTQSAGAWGATNVRIGTVIFSVLPPTNPPNYSCSSRSFPTASSLDLAVAKLDQNVQIEPTVKGVGKPTNITPVLRMMQGDQVTLVGQKSGKVVAELDSLTIFHEIDVDNQPRCFGNIFTLSPTRPWYLNTKLVNFGDSGSWILRRTNSNIGWDGVLVAGDGAHAYASFAEDAFDEVSKNISGNVVLYP